MLGPYLGFGSIWRSDIALEQFDPLDDVQGGSTTGRPEIVVRAVTDHATRTPLRAVNTGHLYTDGVCVRWRDEVSFDMIDGNRIDYLPGPDWTGTLPAAFYGTVAALTLAWRGDLPLHASAVEIGGRTVLIAGPPGSGKSTLAATLLGDGARLLADDLSVIARPGVGAPVTVLRGRPTIRLHPDTAHRIAAEERHAIPHDERGKWLVYPVERSEILRAPLAGILLLGHADTPVAPQAGGALIVRHVFRPKWLAAMPGHAARLKAAIAIAAHVPIHGLSAGDGFHCDAAARNRAHSLVRAMTGL